MVLGLVRNLIKMAMLIALLLFLIQYWLRNKSYIFSEKAVANIAMEYVGKDPRSAYEEIYKDFLTQYSGHILPAEDLQWIFMNAGGWMGSICILHASLTEYVLFFGTGVNTSGNSGRYWANISDTILTGSFRQWKEGELRSTVFEPGLYKSTCLMPGTSLNSAQPGSSLQGACPQVTWGSGNRHVSGYNTSQKQANGDTVYHYWGEVSAVEWTAETWMVEYGRGFIPSTLGFALADTIFSTQDFVTLFYILRVYSKALLLEASTSLTDLKAFLRESL